MQSFRPLVLTTFILIDGFVESSSLKPCKIADQECIDSNANAVYQQLITGIPSLGIQPHDPLHHDLIEGDLSILKFKLYNSTFKGFDKFKISNVKMNSKDLKLHFEIFSPKGKISGQYEISGVLIVLPVQGEGDYEIITGNFKLEVDCELKVVEGSDHEKHLNVKNYKIKSTALSPLKFTFNNLFNGQKDLSDPVHKFANENWKDVADLVQDPVWYAQAKTFFSSANKFLNTVLLDDAVPK